MLTANEVMGRVKRDVEVQGQQFWALFDTGALSTYVSEEVAARLPTFEMEKPERVSLGGRVREVEKEGLLGCLIEGKPVRVLARVLPEIGSDETGRRIHILVGALLMQQWGIIPVPREERLDMTNYPEIFVEY